ncbi:lytic transglycosylase domain-containing protein [Alicyclobacillus sp. SO9]|uniref:lytic transglycosylase domain-containing protein n=1 Tax=Alicyclobacillus sp. SO9 TaxID=2665646 RepID=UPI0018E842CB|nr:lytic transglycosylase domain-containing protein [Alicyclobacillus sp. SO9]QQE78009.1 lytic transglycosylase domain-containing protein [Alicyclobacillus sp. SO9]
MAKAPDEGQRKLRLIVINRRVLISFVLLVAVVTLISSNRFWRWMYPINYQSQIRNAATEAQVDPLLVASVIRVESKFKRTDVSHAGAVGLMQLMPGTAGWIEQKMKADRNVNANGIVIGKITRQKLSNPTQNIRLGAWYIHYLTKQFNGNEVAAIAAYNAGPKRVGDWLSEKKWNGRLQTIQDIPVGETRHFVDRVFYNYHLYGRIYGKDKTLGK